MGRKRDNERERKEADRKRKLAVRSGRPKERLPARIPTDKNISDIGWTRMNEQRIKEKNGESIANFRQSQGKQMEVIANVLSAAANTRSDNGENIKQVKQPASRTRTRHVVEMTNLAEARKKAHAEYKARQRARENMAESKARRQQVKEQMARKRAEEPSPESEARRQKDKEQKRNRRIAERSPELKARRQKDKEQKSRKRIEESPKSTTRRRVSDALRHKYRRSSLRLTNPKLLRYQEAKRKALRLIRESPRSRKFVRYRQSMKKKIRRRLSFHPNASGHFANPELTEKPTAMAGDDFENVCDDVPVGDNFQPPAHAKAESLGEEFHKFMSSLESKECAVCLEEFPELNVKWQNGRNVCDRCRRCKTNKFGAENDMDPGEIPEALEGLSEVESMLIARVNPLFTIWNVQFGQRKYRGNVLNIPQSVEEVAKELPRTVDDGSMVVVRKMGSDQCFRDFHVRRNRVLKALHYLIRYNPYYFDVKLSKENLAKLPTDGFVELPSLDMYDEKLGRDAKDLVQNETEEVSEGCPEGQPNIQASVLPNAAPCEKESDIIERDLDKATFSGERSINWPTGHEVFPIDEFNHVGYIVMAFPTLFPTGKADLLSSNRSMKVTALEYFRHMMRFRDGRFARNPRFPYFAMNSVLRWRAIQTGGYYFKQHLEDKDLTLENLVEMSKKDKNELLGKIERFGSNLPGTTQFWKARRRELICMIDQLRQDEKVQPAIWFTLSSADMCWPDLHRLLPGYDNKAKAVADNPLIVDWFFYKRVQELLEKVFPVLFNMTDFWGRFEFQQRGSAHFHGLAYVEGAPDITDLECASEDRLNQVLAFFDKIVTTWNPGFSSEGKPDAVPKFTQNPACEKYSIARKNPRRDYMGLISYCQRHTRCGKKYCLRKDKSGKETCRFGFPKKLELTSRMQLLIDEKTKEKYYEMVSKRNDPLINSHNRSLLEIHRANVDVQPIVNLRMVSRYISKYLTKSENRSDLCNLLSDTILQQMNPVNPARRIVQKILIKTIAERDYSAQESAHTLMENKLTLCSRSVVYLRLSGTRQLDIVDGGKQESVNVTLPNFVDKYCRRKKFLEEDLLTFAKRHYFGKKDNNGDFKIGNHKKPAVVIPTPYVPSTKNGKKYEEYCKYQLMLRVPFTKIDELKSGCNDFAEAFEKRYPDGIAEDGQSIYEHVERQRKDEDVTGEDSDLHDEDEELNCEEWMHLLKKRKDMTAETFLETSKEYDWHKSFRENPSYASVNTWLQNAKEAASIAVETELIDTSTLRKAQKEAFDLVAGHYDRMCEGKAESPLRLVVTGTAGTGKTRLIKALRQHLGDSVAVVAPTGVAACIITGKTIHNCLKIQTHDFLDLRDEALRQLQDELKNVKYIILDEMSMVGQKMMGMIDKRLRQAFGNSEALLGGRSFVLVGDFGQLAPVMDRPLYSNANNRTSNMSTAHLKERGHVAYHSFEKCIFLDEVVRQDGDLQFRDILLRLRNWQCTDEDYALLSKRFKGNVPISEEITFKDAVHLYSTNAEVESRNFDNLLPPDNSEQVLHPIARIKAENRGGKIAEKADADDAGGLRQHLWLRKGAKVMLTSNLWVEKGLCNGTMGSVIDIVYDTDRPPQLPAFVLCKFPGYSGPSFSDSEEHIFPVVPIERKFSVKNTECSRRMVPLTLAWAVTIHKSQGLTLDKAVVNIGVKEFSAGLTFVGLSRVRAMSDLLLAYFPAERIKCKANAALLERVKAENRLRCLAGLDQSLHCQFEVSELADADEQETPVVGAVVREISVFSNTDGKSCYANSALQALFSLPEVCDRIGNANSPACREYGKLFDRRHEGIVLSADAFRRCITSATAGVNYNPSPDNLQPSQNDPSEFMQDFMDQDGMQAVMELLTFIEKNVGYCNMGHRKVFGTIDPHWVVRTSLPEYGETVFEELRTFHPEPDDMDYGGNLTSECTDCGGIVSMTNYFELTIPPELRYLVICIEKMHHNEQGGVIRHQGRLTGFNPENVQLFGKKFRLEAAILHHGETPYSGHYWTITRADGSGRYISLNDLTCSVSRFNDDLLNKARMLFLSV